MTYLTAEGKSTIYSEEESFAQAFVRNVKEDLKDITRSFFKIGFRLTEANKYRYYEELGYDSITELAEDIFGFKKSTAYGLMQVYSYCRDRSKGASFFDMDKAYVDFNFSQLQEISRLKWGGGEHLIKPTDTVAKIKQFVSAWNKDGESSNASGCESITDYLKKTGRITESESEIFQISGKSDKMSTYMPLLEIATQADPAKDKSSEISDKEYDRLIKDLDRLIAGKPQLTDDELAVYCIRKYGTGREDGKLRLCDKVQSGDFTTSEFISFVKKEYGHYGAFVSDKFHKGIEATDRGLEITRLTGGKLILSWHTVAGRIKRLIENGEYLSAEEQEEYARKSLTPALKNSYETGDGLEWVDPVPVVGKTAMQSSAELTPRRRTRRQYLSELPDEEFVTHLLLQIAKVYPLKCDSAALISSMRKRLIDWLNQPQEVTE